MFDKLLDHIQIIFSNLLLQLVYFIGSLFLFGFLIYLLNRLFYALVKNKTYVCYATGLIGTPIHELSHALMCLVFGHKITEIKLFQIDEESGTLGYVNHSYNPKNWYQVAGNYFIGAAPIFMGTILIYFLIKWLLPDAALELETYMEDFSYLQSRGFSFSWFAYAAKVFGGMIGMVLGASNAGLVWWVFLVLALCIAIHMNLSTADIKGSLKALPILALIFVLFNLLFGIVFFDGYEFVIGYVHLAGSYLTGILILALALSVLSVAIAAAVRGGKLGIDTLLKKLGKKL